MLQLFSGRWRQACRSTCWGGWLLINLLVGCESSPKAPDTATEVGVTQPPWVMMPVAAIRSEPQVRVRVIPQTSSLTLTSPTGQIRVRTSLNSEAPNWVYRSPLTITGQPGRYQLSAAGSPVALVSGSTLHLAAHVPAPGSAPGIPAIDPGQDWLEANGTAYPHGLTVQPAFGAAGHRSFDVINMLPMEEYLPGVLDKELFPRWHPETFRAQAIAARTYAIAQLSDSAGRSFDLEASVASQAYRGKVTNPKALAAVRDTRGAILTWRGQVFPAYYSSCCGGSGQDASAAFAASGAASQITPLQGRYRGAWCAGSSHYRWGPVSVDRQVLSKRLADWGRAHRHPIAGLQGLADIAVTGTNAADRPSGFRITDLSGRVYTLGPEQFRFACNHHAGGLKAPAAEQLLKSSHVQIRMTSQLVIFTGQGLGHGVGLCQWGAQGLAQSGYGHVAILDFYYPGAAIIKAY